MVFFSYCRTDGQTFALKLAEDLRNTGFNVWMDQSNIQPGKKWDIEVESALDNAECILFISTEKSTTSTNVLDEVYHALDKNKKVIPPIADKCSLPFRLKRLQFIDFTTDYNAAFNQLLKALRLGNENQQRPVSTINQKDEKEIEEKKVNEDATEKQSIILKVVGIVFILCAALIALLVQQPTKAQYFILYALIGIGIALLLAKSAGHTAFQFKVWNTSVALAGGVALPFILFFTNPIGSFKQGNDSTPTTTSVTVFVHGKGGRQDIILRQQGHIVMDVKGGERKRADINENGAAFFQNLEVGEKVQLEVDFSEPYKSLYPDSAYVIPADGRIYLSVALQGIDNVRGKVFYNNVPLADVIVEINDLTDTTDGTGKFNISIPEAQQTKEYKVWFTKPGFKTKSAPAFPQTGQAVEVVLEKSSLWAEPMQPIA